MESELTREAVSRCTLLVGTPESITERYTIMLAESANMLKYATLLKLCRHNLPRPNLHYIESKMGRWHLLISFDYCALVQHNGERVH